MSYRKLFAALAAVLFASACQPAGHQASDRTSASASASASASPSPSASRPRLTAAQLKAAVLQLSDLPSGYKLDHSDDSVPDNRCVKLMYELFKGSVMRTYIDQSSTFSVVASVDTAAAGRGSATIRRYRDLTDGCGRYTFAEQGVRANVTFTSEPAPTLLDESAGFVERSVFTDYDSTMTAHLIVFRYGDNVGMVGVGAETGSHLASNTVTLARKAAARLRDTANG